MVPMPRENRKPAPKRPTNVSIRGDLLVAARKAGLNLSATLERALIEELAESRRKKWREENREAIAAYNERVDRHGVFAASIRRF